MQLDTFHSGYATVCGHCLTGQGGGGTLGPGVASVFFSSSNSITISVLTINKYLDVNCVCSPFEQSKFSVNVSWINE